MVLLMLAALLATTALVAQTPVPPPAFKATTDYVTFSVRVMTKGGKQPRLGLTPADFLVRVDGRPRAISRLEIMNAGKPDQVYVLAFEPTSSDRDGRPHKMDVQVKGIGTVVKRTFTIGGLMAAGYDVFSSSCIAPMKVSTSPTVV